MSLAEEQTKDSYWTLAGPAEGIFSEKRSKFLAFAYPVTTEEEALAYVSEVRAKYYDARHVCWAYRLGPTGEPYRSNDDGEPSGTAGKPILGILSIFEVSYFENIYERLELEREYKRLKYSNDEMDKERFKECEHELRRRGWL